MRRFILIIALCLLALSSNDISLSDSVTSCRSFDSCTSFPTKNGICHVNISYTKYDSTPDIYSPACIENSCRQNCTCSCASENGGSTSYYNSCKDRIVLASFTCSGCTSGGGVGGGGGGPYCDDPQWCADTLGYMLYDCYCTWDTPILIDLNGDGFALTSRPMACSST